MPAARNRKSHAEPWGPQLVDFVGFSRPRLTDREAQEIKGTWKLPNIKHLQLRRDAKVAGRRLRVASLGETLFDELVELAKYRSTTESLNGEAPRLRFQAKTHRIVPKKRYHVFHELIPIVRH